MIMAPRYSKPEKLVKLNDISSSEIQVGQEYDIDVTATYGCIWETSMLDIHGLKKEIRRMYLVPLESEENTYIGVMMDDTIFVLDGVIDKVLSYVYTLDDVKTYKGEVKSYDWIMSKLIPDNIEALEIDTSNMTILPMYVDTCSDMKVAIILAFILIFIAIIVGVIIAKKREKEREPEREIVLYQRSSSEEYIWHRSEQYTWHQSVCKQQQHKANIFTWFNAFSYGDVEEQKSVYSAFKKYYGRRLCSFILKGTFAIYLVYGIVFSFNPHKWYYGLCEPGLGITYMFILVWVCLIAYYFICWLINPMKLAINKYIRNKSHYSKEYINAFLSTGKLFTSGGGYAYVSKDFLVVGNSSKLFITRHYNIVKITWCEKVETLMDKKNKVNWIRVYEDNGETYDAVIKWKTAYYLLNYLRKLYE